MEKFTVIIEETVAQEFEVNANDEHEALEIAREKYELCEFVLESNEVQSKRMAVVQKQKVDFEWVEF